MLAAERRARTRKQADALASHPRYQEILEDLTAYIELVIPWTTDSIDLELGQMRELLSSPTVLKGARQMALGLMRRGRSNFAKFHSDDLLDAILVGFMEEKPT